MIPDEENALVTSDYVIMPYRLLGGPTKEVYILDGHDEGEWWYSLNDGLLDVGRFTSREAAIEQATNWIEHIAATWAATSAACQLRKDLPAPMTEPALFAQYFEQFGLLLSQCPGEGLPLLLVGLGGKQLLTVLDVE